MIINLTGKPNNRGEIVFDTQVYFDRETHVAVTQVYVELSKRVSEVSGLISSSLVDKSPINPKQQLVLFHQREKSRSIFYEPRHLVYYGIQSQSLQSSFFEINCADSDGNTVKVDQVTLQLKIISE